MEVNMLLRRIYYNTNQKRCETCLLFFDRRMEARKDGSWICWCERREDQAAALWLDILVCKICGMPVIGSIIADFLLFPLSQPPSMFSHSFYQPRARELCQIPPKRSRAMERCAADNIVYQPLQSRFFLSLHAARVIVITSYKYSL